MGGVTGDVVFIAHDVGGSGGMERQSEQLVLGLLDAGLEVTVIARTCSLAGRERVRFVRVAAPRRPATIAYPAFFVMASLLARRHRAAARDRAALIHTTGAVVANRAHVANVHFCHRAAATQIEGSRASRPHPLYRLNAAVSGWLSRAGEWWCYRPARTRLLCAVSDGVAGELRRHFPRMSPGVRTVPNGVDTARFRPDPRAGAALHARLRLPDGALVALFVGGDWERKGLRYAVEALELAPEWHLVVAGDGDLDELRARARAAGAPRRVHALGRVDDMPPLYAAADAFVFPTAYEAFPLVALEAAAAGLPLLVTPVNGVQQLVEHGVNGFFVERDGRAIARRLNELAADAERRTRMAAAARAAACGFTWEAMTAGYLSVYSEL